MYIYIYIRLFDSVLQQSLRPARMIYTKYTEDVNTGNLNRFSSSIPPQKKV